MRLSSLSLLAFLAILIVKLPVSVAQDAPKKKIETKELVTQTDLKKLRSLYPNFRKAVGKSNPSQSETNVIKDYIRIQILQMSLEEKREDLPAIRKTVKQHFAMRLSQAARDLILSETVKNSKMLLKYPLPVRLNAVMLIAELNQTSANIAKSLPAIPYEGKTETLLAVIRDAEQHQAVKIVAVNGLYRLCKDSSIKVSLRKKIGVAVVQELKKPESDPWYKRVCMEALSVVDDLYDARRKPYIIQALCEILIDNQQHWQVRAVAAYSLGRVKMDGQINLPLINHEIARYTHELGMQFNRKPKEYYWKICVFRVYSAYRKVNERDVALLDRVKGAPLSKHSANVRATYDHILPIVNDVYSRPNPLPKSKVSPIPDDKLKALKDFIEKNVPASFAVAPGSTPLRKTAAPEKKE